MHFITAGSGFLWRKSGKLYIITHLSYCVLLSLLLLSTHLKHKLSSTLLGGTVGISNMKCQPYINWLLCSTASFLLSHPFVYVLILHLLPYPADPFANKETHFSVITQGRSSSCTTAQGYSTNGTQTEHATWKGHNFNTNYTTRF